MDFNMVIGLNPKLADAYCNKAVAGEIAGRAGKAREAYPQFLKVAPARKKLEEP
jgi:Flp pilus assembly protein TadD